ncbi:hypothetical protein G4923_10495 [Aeromonas rivipollensis]|uniref:Uncharacterized protein n=1 Tax=Aeromonas rivipollensis TaxID=948519 RepID=A0ABX0CZE0_9GAMM|nr:hypothetical protein [Aeromonas rivipollensis]NEX89132.1 hypothetical protein [Aeromonas rivipollensis]NEY04998.1 hypothetical protein [Aeromonas rivipollensis]
MTGARWQRAATRLNAAVDDALGIAVIIAGHPLVALYDENPDAFGQVLTTLRELSVTSPPPGVRFKSGDKVEIPSMSLVTSVREPPFTRAGQLVIPIK